MRSLVLFFFLFSSTLFSAPPIFCHSSHWSAKISSDLSRAQLFFDAKPVKFGYLKCHELFKRTPSTEIIPIVNCLSTDVFDALYVLYIYKVIENQKLEGELSELSFIGSKKIAKLNCIGGYFFNN